MSDNRILDEIKQLLREERTTFETALSQAKNNADNLRTEDTEKLNRIEADFAELRKSYDEAIATANRITLNTTGEPNNPQTELRQKAFNLYVRGGMTELSNEEVRALGTADSDGGFFVPPDFERMITTKAYELAEIRPRAYVATTGRDLVKIPKMSQVTMTWATKGIAIDKSNLGTGQENLYIWALRGLVRIANDTLEDTESDVIGELNNSFPRAIAQAEDEAFAIGTGEMPLGIFTDPRVQANVTMSGVSGELTDATHDGFTAMLDMLYKLKATYRINATWIFNSLTESVLRKVKDAEGQYLWQPPVQAGDPPTLLGKPTIAAESVADIASNAYVIVIGDLMAGYHIRDRMGYSLIRDQSLYREYDETGFFIKSRVGGQVVLPEAFRILQIST